MNVYDAVWMSLSDLYFRRFRTALATLGIVFGVAAVQAMLCIGEGAREEALAGIARLGVDKIFVRSDLPKNAPPAEEGDSSTVERHGLMMKDQTYVDEYFSGVRQTTAARSLSSTVFSIYGKETAVSVTATQAAYREMIGARMLEGRFLHQLDEERMQDVCVLGTSAARKIFFFDNPLGQSVSILGKPFTVVGVLENTNETSGIDGNDISNTIYIPLAAALYLTGDPYFNSQGQPQPQIDAMIIQVDSIAAVQPLVSRLRQWLKREQRAEECTIQIPLAVMRQQEATRRIFSLVMTTIAGISLLVGGIGIMNIMLANVSERKREIGTRRALGARQRDILFQFCFEASVLSSFGGLLGIAVGYGLTLAVAHYAGWPVLITPINVAVGFCAAVITGIVFGYWPAKQAARVVPIEALRAM